MTPSQLKNNATKDDIIMLGAYFQICNDDIPKPESQPAPPARRSRRR
jgi:hypothetical protein